MFTQYHRGASPATNTRCNTASPCDLSSQAREAQTAPGTSEQEELQVHPTIVWE